MLIALLAILGVDLIVVVVLVASALSRRRWVAKQPGAFHGAIRIADGDVPGLGSKWSRGYGRWVSDVLVWTKAPLLLRNEILATDGIGQRRPARPGEVRRLGDSPYVVQIAIGGATAEVVARDEDADKVAGNYSDAHTAAARRTPLTRAT